MNKVLVTGGCGFVGSHLVQLLQHKGFNVRVLDIRSPMPAIDKVEYQLGSILNIQDVQQAMIGINFVYHVAANPNLWAKNKNDFMRVNYDGTCNILQVAQQNPVQKIVYTSTESILSSAKTSKQRGITDEKAQPTLADMPGIYCRSKLLAEQAALAAAQRGLPLTVVNPTLPIGPGDLLLTPPSRMILDFLNGRNPAYLETTFNVIDVRDVAEGHYLAMENGQIGERYILGGENIKLSQILCVLEELTGRNMPKRRIPYWVALGAAVVSEIFADITKIPPRAPLTGVRLAATPMAFDTKKAKLELGLTVRSARQSLEDMIEWFISKGYLT